MIAEKFVDLLARNSGIRDKIIAETEVILNYALRSLHDEKLLDHLAFKGGTALRKFVFGKNGRFSLDLDFTHNSPISEDDIQIELIEHFNKEFYGITFSIGNDDWYQTEDDSLGVTVNYKHEWNSSGHFKLQVSTREKPTLPLSSSSFLEIDYLKRLEFDLFNVPTLNEYEILGEKLRATYQRDKVRDLFDLYSYASSRPLPKDVLRAMMVLKLWQSKDPFDPEKLFNKIPTGNYDWDDLRRLINSNITVDKDKVTSFVISKFSFLKDLTDLEREVISDAKSGHNIPLGDKLRDYIRDEFAKTVTS